MQTETPPLAEVLDDLTETSEGGIQPAHTPTDPAHLAAIRWSMEMDGWIGAPLLVDGEQALTGSHRFYAAQAAEVDIPRVQAADLAAAYGLDWAGILADNDDDWYRAGIALTALLPADVVEYLGLDLH